jgi:putative transposase
MDDRHIGSNSQHRPSDQILANTTNMLERLNQELKRRTLVVRIFPNAASCLRLVRALAAETHEGWLEATRYLNMEHLKERKKEALRAIAA